VTYNNLKSVLLHAVTVRYQSTAGPFPAIHDRREWACVG